MADGNFSWVFELLDKMSGPSKKMGDGLSDLSEKLNKTEKAAGSFHEKILDAFAITEITKTVAELASKLVDLGEELGAEALKAADFERRMDVAFTSLTGGAQAAGQTVSQLKMVANAFGASTEEVAGGYAQMIQMGFKAKDVLPFVAAAYDIQAKTLGRTKATGVMDIFGTIMSRGSLEGRQLMMLNGVINDRQWEVLGKKLGVAATSASELRKKLQEMKGVDATKGLQAIFDTLKETGSGKVGQAGMDAADTWDGATKRIKNNLESLLGEFQKTDAYAGLLDIANGLAMALDPKSPDGRKILSSLNMIGEQISKMLAPLKDPAAISGFVDGLTTAMNAVLAITGAIGTMLKWGAKQYTKDGMIGQGVSGVAGAVGSGLGAANSWWQNLGSDAGQMYVSGFRGARGIQAMSPSKKFMTAGKDAADGFGLGMMASLNQGQTFSGVMSKSLEGARRMTVPITINASTSEGKGLADKARDVVLSALAAAFEEVALESGVG